MCGITGVYGLQKETDFDKGEVVQRMADSIQHRGPDDSSIYLNGRLAFGFRRLSIVDLLHGNQPFYSPDKSVVLVCNGEIFNHKELRAELERKGYVFSTRCDVEVIVFLYLEYGINFLNKLNGQFAFALYDQQKELLFLARDQFGICPLHYSMLNNVFLFASEIKALLAFPGMPRDIDLSGLDQLFTFPATIAPVTFFKHIKSLEPGHYALVTSSGISVKEYWDLEYPPAGHVYAQRSETDYIDELEHLLKQSVQYRLMADVPVGFYLSGGLDSSVIGGMMRSLMNGSELNSFSICFGDSAENKDINESRYQQMMSRHIGSTHNEIEFNWDNMDAKLGDVIYYAESPLKETYNVCSIALSQNARAKNIKVILSGEGSDELFGGYAGYKFDHQRSSQIIQKDLEYLMEDQVRKTLWGDENFIYEKNEYEFRNTKEAIYSGKVNGLYSQFDCLKQPAVNHARMKGKSMFHQRAYADFKLRLAGHLIADHGDRMTFANSVEGRYPFLDINLIEFVRKVPAAMLLKDMTEKYILKKVAARYIPEDIIKREKFGFVAPGSPQLLHNCREWANDMLSYEQIKRQGYFNPDTVERLKKMYTRDGFILNPPYDSDLLIVIITFNMFLKVFNVPNL